MADEETELCRRWRAGDDEAGNVLSSRYGPGIRKLAHKWARREPCVEPDDLEMAGFCGLWKALCKVDLNNGGKPLRPYAIKSIKNEMWNSYEYTRGMPRLQSERYRLLCKTEKELMLKLHREPTEEEIAQRAGLTLKEIGDVSAARAFNRPAQPPEEGLDSFIALSAVSPVEEATKNLLWEHVLRALASGKFSEREIDIIVLRYLKDMKTCEIAELLCLKENHVNTIHSRVIKKLRNMLTGTDEE